MKSVKWLLGILVGLVVLAIVVAVAVAALFDPNAYKPQIVQAVKDRTGRTLDMQGNIGLTFFPKIGAAVDGVTLSEPNGTKAFAKVNEARVAVALWPLFSRKVIVDQVVLSGLAVELVRFKDGRTNFDDLAGGPAKPEPSPVPGSRPAESGAPLAVDIGGIALRDANIGWRDEASGTNVRLVGANLTTGRIASGVPGKLAVDGRVEGAQPRLNLALEGRLGYRVDFDTQAVALSAVDLNVRGDAPGLAGLDARVKGDTIDVDPKATRVNLAGVEVTARSKDGLDAKLSAPKLMLSPERAESQAVTGEVRFVQPGRSIDARLALAALEQKGAKISFARFDVDLDLKQGELGVQGKIGTPVSVDLEARQALAPGIAGDLVVTGPAIPGKRAQLLLKGGARADWGKETANAELAARLDDSNIQARLGLVKFGAPQLAFDVTADKLNVDRYLPPKAKPASGGEPKGAGPAAAAADQPIDLAGLKTLNARGSVKIGALVVSNVKLDNVSVAMKAAGGRVDVSPIAANLYLGSLAGSASVDANTNAFAAQQRLTNVSIGPLLRDVAQQDVLEGRGNVALDVTAKGNTVAALKRALDGTASVALRDGALKGIDIPGTIRQVRAMVGSRTALEQQAKGGAQTDFTELTASFVIRKGVAHNDDLQGKSPLLRLAGAGDIDIGAGTMNYGLQATVVATSTGQGGKDLSQVAGLTVPVQVTGPFENLTYTVDVAAVATELAKQELTRQLERRLGGGQSGGSQGGGSTAEQLLRGLLRK